MKRCNICQCNTHEKHTHCPICGSYLDDNPVPFPKYETEIEPNVKNPIVHIVEKPDFLKEKSNYILLFLAVVCVALNILLTPGTYWSAYVCIGAVFTVLCIMLPISNKSKVYMQIILDLPVITILSIAMELIIKRGNGAAISMMYILPSLFAGAILLIDAMIIATAKKRTTGYFSTLLYATVYAIAPQILIWAWFYNLGYNSIVAFSAFFFSLINLGIVSICSHKRIREEYDKKMNM